MKIIVSACLLGINCAWNGSSKLSLQLMSLIEKGEISREDLIPVCPERLGGMKIPRPRSEIETGTGEDVLDRRCKVISIDGSDVTAYFVKGAYETLKIARISGAQKAILRHKSPSCGCGMIYDGTFSDKLRKGNGVTAALLKRRGIEVINDEDL